ncbi:MAG: hypothetical protein ACOYCD_06955, partial [Kiritimatiellia bacterium]
KEKEIFAGFVRRQAASRWGGFLPVRAENLAQNGFALRSVIATIFVKQPFGYPVERLLLCRNIPGSPIPENQRNPGRETAVEAVKWLA